MPEALPSPHIPDCHAALDAALRAGDTVEADRLLSSALLDRELQLGDPLREHPLKMIPEDWGSLRDANCPITDYMRDELFPAVSTHRDLIFYAAVKGYTDAVVEYLTRPSSRPVVDVDVNDCVAMPRPPMTSGPSEGNYGFSGIM